MRKCVVEVERFIEEQKEAGKADNTVKTYERIMNTFADWLDHNDGELQELLRCDVQTYINVLESDGKSAATIDIVLACLSVHARFVGRSDAMDRYSTYPTAKEDGDGSKVA